MSDFESKIKNFITTTRSPYLILFIIDYKNDIENSIESDSLDGFKLELSDAYVAAYQAVKNQKPEKRLYDVQWCVWEKLFAAAERRKKFDCTVSSKEGSSEIVGVKRLLDEMSITDWKIPNPAEEGLMIGDENNFSKIFFDYQVECLSKFKLEQFYNWRTDLQNLLALSSIVFLDGIRGACSFLDSNMYQVLYRLIRCDTGNTVALSSDAIEDLQGVLREYNEEYDYWATIGKIIHVHDKYKDNNLVNYNLEVLLSLLPEMTVFERKRSEMHVQCSYVHNFIKSIFKVDPWHHPHCSNTNNNFYSTRPDYLVDIQGSDTTMNNVFGECKAKHASIDSCNRDKYRLALFSQVAMQQQKLKSVMSFFSVDNEVTFYMMKKMNGMYFFIQIAKITIPTIESKFQDLGMHLNKIAMIRELYLSHCHEKEQEVGEFVSLPWTVLSEMTVKK